MSRRRGAGHRQPGVVCMMLGLALMPHLLPRAHARKSAANEEDEVKGLHSLGHSATTITGARSVLQLNTPPYDPAQAFAALPHSNGVGFAAGKGMGGDAATRILQQQKAVETIHAQNDEAASQVMVLKEEARSGGRRRPSRLSTTAEVLRRASQKTAKWVHQLHASEDERAGPAVGRKRHGPLWGRRRLLKSSGRVAKGEQNLQAAQRRSEVLNDEVDAMGKVTQAVNQLNAGNQLALQREAESTGRERQLALTQAEVHRAGQLSSALQEQAIARSQLMDRTIEQMEATQKVVVADEAQAAELRKARTAQLVGAAIELAGDGDVKIDQSAVDAAAAALADDNTSHDDMLASLEDEASQKEHIDHHGEVQEDDEDGEEGGDNAGANDGADTSNALDGVRHHTTKTKEKSAGGNTRVQKKSKLLYIPRIYADSKFETFYENVEKQKSQQEMDPDERKKARMKERKKFSDIGGKQYQDWRKRDHEAQVLLHTSSSRMKQKQHDELEKLKQDETNIRQQQLPYAPGSNTPHVASLPTLRMHAKALRMWEESLRSHGASSTLDTMRQGTCAVVGNSGLLSKTEFGAEIDAHDIVVRLNAAPTHGYEKHVGSKTTARALNNALSRVLADKIAHSWSKEKRNQVLGEDVQLWLRATEQTHVDLAAALKKVHDPRVIMLLDHEFTYASIPFFRQFYKGYLDAVVEVDPKNQALQNRIQALEESHQQKPADDFGKHGDSLFGKPTTGMAVLYALKDVCQAVSLFGFGTHDEKGNPTTYKYYRPDAKTSLVGNLQAGAVGSHTHSFLFEQELMHAMSNDGVVKLCTYDSEATETNKQCRSAQAPRLENKSGNKRKSKQKGRGL